MLAEPDGGFERWQASRHLPLLDGLRCLSIVAVVWHHAAGTSAAGLLGRGHEGVSLFFVISGFLITTLLLRERARSGDIDLRSFYLRRSLRIFPLYYAVLALYVVLVATLERGTAAGQQFWSNLPWYLSYTSNWFVQLDSPRVIFYFAWSLATEEQFYLLWPLLVKTGRTARLPIAFMTALLLLALGTPALLGGAGLLGPGLGGRMLASISPAICLGALAAYLVHDRRGFAWARRFAGQRWSGAAALVAVLVTLAVDGAPALLVQVAMTWLVLACSLRTQQPLRPLLDNRLFAHIGKVSYGMYLLHMLALNGARHLVGEQAGPGLFLATLAVSVAAATASHHLLERPFLRLKDRLTTARIAPRPQPAPAPESPAIARAG